MFALHRRCSTNAQMTARRAQLLLCLALAARGVCAQNATNASSAGGVSSSNATSPPPAASAPPPPSPPAPSGSPSDAAAAATDEQLWLLQDNQCRVRVPCAPGAAQR